MTRSTSSRSPLGDIVFVLGLAALFLPFVFFAPALEFFKGLTADHPLLMSFAKFAVLATSGELLALRIRTGSYYQSGFGVAARAVVWGFLGVGIYIAFVIFSRGAVVSLQVLGLPISAQVLAEPFSGYKVLAAFWVSLTMNVVFAPVMMTLHKITDEHILQNSGRVSALLRPIPIGEILARLDWSVMWGFVFKKTIPLFWIPAHTVTFLLPPEYRVLFAAILGIVLGVLLAVASLRSRQ